MPAAPGTIVVVDDHHLFTELLTIALKGEERLRCVGSAASIEEGIRLVEQERPSIVLLDVHLPDGSGVEAIPRFTAPDRRVVVLTGDSDPHVLVRAAAQGAAGFVLKSSDLNTLISLLRASEHGLVIDPNALTTRPVERDEDQSLLTPRESDVLNALGRGAYPRLIARDLEISTHTVRGHIKSIFGKLGVHSQLEAVLEGARRGLISPMGSQELTER